jgi:hypothetical protein
MGRVITLDFLRRGPAAKNRNPQPVQAEPLFSDAEIWARDYAAADGVVFGVCALAAILSRHLGREGQWPPLLVGLLEAAHRPLEPDAEALSRAARNLKDLLLSETSRENAQDFSAALLIADLIEYTPRYRAGAR